MEPTMTIDPSVLRRRCAVRTAQWARVRSLRHALNAAILRSLQESLASELAARMNAMQNASDNAKDLKKVRQTKSDGEVVIDSSTSGTPPV
jgi:hypothetical protein